MEVTDHIDVTAKSPTEKGRPPSTIISGAWMGLRADLNAFDDRKISFRCPESKYVYLGYSTLCLLIILISPNRNLVFNCLWSLLFFSCSVYPHCADQRLKEQRFYTGVTIYFTGNLPIAMTTRINVRHTSTTRMRRHSIFAMPWVLEALQYENRSWPVAKRSYDLRIMG